VRIGVLTTSYPRWRGDSAGSFVEGHAHALRAMGHDVEVIAAGDTPTEGVHRIPGRGLFYSGGAPDLLERSPRSLLAAARFTAHLAATVARCRYDSIIAHWLAPSAIAALPSRAPLLAIAHGGDVHTLRRLHLLGPVLHLLHRRGARLAFVSSALRDRACAAAPGLRRWLDDAIVQPMGVDLARFAAIGRAPVDPPMILVAARLVPIKGVDLMLDALAHLRTPARLVIAGDGPERARLVSRGTSATFVGQVDTGVRDRLLREASVVVVPSRVMPNGRTEGTPMIALEALATGAPVVASIASGLDLAGVRVAPPTARGLAATIDDVLRSPPDPRELSGSIATLDWRAVADRLMGEKPVTPGLRRGA
jgi:glycosyltransferase involved in cell wall biosynthesis